MDFTSLSAKIASGTVPPVLYLYGEDTYLVQRSLTLLRDKVITRARDFNLSQLDAKDNGIEAIVLASRMLPMMAERRLVIASRIDEVKGDALLPLVTYVADPSPQSVLVLLGRALDQRTKLGQLLVSKDYLCNCEPMRRPQLQKFASHEAKAMNLSVDATVYEMLFDAYGSDLSQWILALERFALYLGVGSKGPVGVVDETVAEALVMRTRAESVFALTDAVLSGRAHEALPLAEQLVQQKEAPLAMVALISRQVRQLMLLREAMDQGVAQSQALRTAGIPPFVADKFINRAREVSMPLLLRAQARLVEADIRLKSSPLGESATWFSALWDIMSEGPPAP